MSTISASEAMGDGESKGKEAAQQRIRRRNRMITSCLECRRRKLKCDKLHPCTNCSKFARDCMFLAPALDSVSQKKLNELKEKMGSLEKVLEDDIARRTNIRTESGDGRKSSADLPGEDSNSDSEAVVPEDERRLEATPMAAFDAAYEDGSNGDVLDVGIRIGMLRITERIGGMFRPRFSEEMAFQLGAPIRKDLNDPDVPKLPDHDDFISPGPTYIAPGAGFLFGDVGSRRNLVDFLPSKAAADTLIREYYRRCHFIARTVHWPSFQAQYDNFWAEVLSGIEPAASLQAVIMSILFSAVASMEEDEVTGVFGNPKSSVLISFQTATEVALSKAHFLRTTRMETLQALVIYLIPMCRDALSRAHSVLVGTAIRLAECIGLHRDPAEHFGISPIEAHVRRILWFELCFLDYYTAEKQGPRPSIKREDYDTRFPLNVNDTDLMAGKIKEDDSVWTDMTMSRLRFECCEMWRIYRVDIERLHQKKISITHALGKIESFRRAMEAKYHPMLNVKVPIHRYAKHVLSLSIYKMHVGMLHRYHSATELRIPDRLRQVVIESGCQSCESAMEVYNDPDFKDWRWYATALHGWPTALVLLSEIFNFPQRRQADRIWAILDFVFKPNLSLTRDQKARQILSATRDRTAFYRDLRGFRVPVSMQNRLATTIPIREGPRIDGPDMILSKQKSTSTDRRTSHSMKPSPRSPVEPDRTKSMQVPEQSMSTSERVTPDGSVSTASWTFDNPYTFYGNGPAPHPVKSGSRASSTSPATAQIVTQPPAAPPSIAFTSSDGIPGLSNVDTGHSPSNSSSNAENWPPPISSEQNGWRYAFSSPPPQQQSLPQQRQHSPQDAYSRPTARADNFGRLPPGQMAHQYIPTGTAGVQMPYVGGGHEVPITTQGNLLGSAAVVADPAQACNDAVMVDINWAEWDKIFPPDSNTGNLDHPESRH